MRILQILLSDRIGGAESLAEGLCRSWQSSGHQAEIHFLDGRDDERRLNRIVRLRRRIASFQPDILVSHSTIPNRYTRLVVPRQPVVTVLHSSANDHSTRIVRVVERILRRRTAHVVAVGSSQAIAYRSQFGDGVPITVIPNGIRDDTTMRPPLAFGGRVVTLARVADVKNPRLWTRVAETGRGQGLTFEWWGPPDGSSMAEYVDAHTASRRAGTFRGPTSDVNAVLSSADILFHPSDREAQCLSVLEAAAVGLPIVCSQAVADVLPDDLPLVVFRTGDAMDAWRALESVAKDFDRYSDSAAAAAQRVRVRFSMAACADDYVALLRRLTTP